MLRGLKPNQHQNHCGGAPGRLGDDESDGVREVVEVDGLPVAVDVRRDDSEAVEVGAAFLVAGPEEHRPGLAVEHDEDGAQAAVGGRVVSQGPVVRGAVGVDVGRVGAAVPAGALGFGVQAVGGVEVEALAAGAFDRDPEEVLGDRAGLGLADTDAVGRVKEADVSGAVGDAAVE